MKELSIEQKAKRYEKALERMKSWVRGEHKSAWSEEDERICQCLIRDQEKALDDVRNDKYGHSEIVSDLKEMYRERIVWLKSLKDQVQPQPKQDWSEEDEQITLCYR